MEILIVADTHITTTGSRRLPPAVYRAAQRCDVILHAGDIVVPEVLEDLRTYATVHAVRGNNDAALGGLPETITIDLDGVRVGMIHDAGARAGRERRLRAMFPDADVVVFGHSHIPLIARGLDDQLLINPGSATDKRREPHHTFARAQFGSGVVVRARLQRVRP